ncbi:MAG: YciI family protein [Alphaproteobacteria bacterium]|nr:YciI family protein [Alphaproteobacteria bacterium]
MEYFVYCSNKPKVDALRAEHQEAHWAFMDQYEDRMIARGPTLAEDGKTPNGSMHIVDLESEEEAKTFAHDEPYAKAGVFTDITIRRWTNALKRTMWDFQGDVSSTRFLCIGYGPLGIDSTARRNELLQSHRDYLSAPGRVERGILRGPLWDSAGEKWIGSIFLIEAPDPTFIKAFFVDEPYTKDGLYERFEMLLWRFGGRN